MCQFDISKKRWDATSDESLHDLQKLAGRIEEEKVTCAEEETPEEGPSQDNNEGWIDKQEDMAEKDIDELEESVWP